MNAISPEFMNNLKTIQKNICEVKDMSIIQCDEDCIYQREGYCSLETPTVITNNSGKGCVYSIKLSPKQPPNIPNDFNRLPPQMPL